MSSKLFLLTVYFAIVLYNQCNSTILQEYAWRDYWAEVPNDAFKAGKDRDGSPIYIGQAKNGKSLLVGKIYEYGRGMYLCSKSTQKFEMKHVQILCSETPERFTWVLTDLKKIYRLWDKHIVVGGDEDGYDVYVGRAFFGGETVVGKIVYNITGSPVFCSTSGSISFNIYDKAEILTYNPQFWNYTSN